MFGMDVQRLNDVRQAASLSLSSGSSSLAGHDKLAACRTAP